MKKLFISALSVAFIGSGLLFTSCSKKKDDPAPVATTTTTTGGSTGTTTSGTTTSGTTTSGSTTSGSTTTGTTTSGTTTSGTTTSGTTTSGSTTSGTTTSTTGGGTTGTAGSTYGGSGTFSVNGANNIPTIMLKSASSGLTVTITQNDLYSLQVTFGNTAFTAGSYSVIDYLSGNPSGMQAKVVLLKIAGSVQYWSTASSGSVSISGNTVTFSNVTLKQYSGTETVTVSGNYTFN